MSRKVKGCPYCDQLRKGSRKVKKSRNPRVHWVMWDAPDKWMQKPCWLAPRASRTDEGSVTT